ncbi:MAG: hypothetical protein M3R70_07490 [Actinomycetota bacterium]|nr:hypothetical protein [Actinomycetota bacterium]
MTSVAYDAGPQRPGWVNTGIALVLGWIAAAAAVLVLAIAGTLLGVVDPSVSVWRSGVLDMPFQHDGTWSVFADLSALALVLLVATVATAWIVRDRLGPLSERRLAAVLLLTGWMPLAAHPQLGGVLGFILAIWLVRRYVLGSDDRLHRRIVFLASVGFALIVASYGLLHPLSVTYAGEGERSVLLTLTNRGHSGVVVERLAPGPIGGRPTRGLSWEQRALPGTRLAGGDSTLVTIRFSKGSCVNALPDMRVGYRVFGHVLTAPARVKIPGVGCQ